MQCLLIYRYECLQYKYQCKDDGDRLTGEQIDKYYWGGKTVHHLYQGNDEHTKDKTAYYLYQGKDDTIQERKTIYYCYCNTHTKRI